MSTLNLQAILQLTDRITRPLKQISGESAAASRALKEARDKVKELQRVQGDVNSFKAMKRAMGDNERALKQAQDRVRQLAEQMRATTAPTAAMKREFEKAKEAARALRQQHTEQHQQLQRLRDKLKAAGVDTRNLADHERRLRESTEQANQAMRRQQERLRELGERQRKLTELQRRHQDIQGKISSGMGQGAAMVAGGAAAGAMLSVPVKAYAEAEDAAAQLRAALMNHQGKVAPEFQAVNDLATRLGNQLPGTTADFQNMMTMLVKQGVSVKAILGGVGEASALLAVQMKLPFEEAAEMAAKLQDATKTTERDMLGLMDTIQRSYYLGVDKGNMVSGFSKLAAGMKTIKAEGLAGAQAIAPLLVMADQAAMAGESAGNAYSKIFAKMMDTGNVKEQLAKFKKETGVSLAMDFTNGQGEFGGLDKMFKQLEKLKSMSTEARLPLLSGLFGNDGDTIQALNLLIDKGQSGYLDIRQKMESQASLQQRVNEQLGTLKNLWDAATGTFTNALASVGEAVAPELKALTRWIAEVSEGMGRWARKNPGMANLLMKIIGLIALTAVVLGGLTVVLLSVLGPLALLRVSLMTLGVQFPLLTALLGGLATALRVIGATLMGVGRLMLTNPIGWILMAIAGAAYLIYRNWAPIKTFFVSLWDGISTGAVSLWNTVKSGFSKGWEAIKALLGGWHASAVGFGSNLIEGLLSGINSQWEKLKGRIRELGDMLPDWLRKKLGINSPSRVFAEIGLHSMTGLQQGLRNNQDGPVRRVADLSRQLTRAGAGIALGAAVGTAGALTLDNRPPLSPAAAGARPVAVGGDTYHITINAAPGVNEQALAALVRRELEAAQRQKAARARSALYDND